MVQLFLTIFMIVTYALAAAILTYVSICSIEDSKDQQQFDTIAKSIEEQNEDGVPIYEYSLLKSRRK